MTNIHAVAKVISGSTDEVLASIGNTKPVSPTKRIQESTKDKNKKSLRRL
jgi:hypothetical protein